MGNQIAAVTGGFGLVGSSIVALLISEGWKVKILSRSEKFDIDGNILFEEPEIDINANWAFVQHEILKINDNQYLFFIPEDQLHPVP